MYSKKIRDNHLSITISFKPFVFGLILLAAAFIMGCAEDSPSNPTATTPPATYLFYEGSLFAVDPDSLATPIQVDPGNITKIGQPLSYSTLETFWGVTSYNSGPPVSVSGLHIRTLVYARDGSFFKVSAQKGNGLPTPVQVSNENNAANICETHTGYDRAHHDNSSYLYRLPGSDNVCRTSDDLWKMIRLGMTRTDAPIPAKKPLIEIEAPSTGAMIGWLAIDNKNLYRYDTAFANPVLVTPFTTGVTDCTSNASDDLFLVVDNTLRLYNVSAGNLSPALHTFSGSGVNYCDEAEDKSNLYLRDGASLHKVPLNGNSPSSLLVKEGGNTLLSLVGTTDTRVIYKASGTSTSLKAVDKTEGTALVLDTISSALFAVESVVGNRIYYTVVEHSGHRTAKVVRDDGTIESSFSNAAWIGASIPTNLTIDSEFPVQTLILAEGLSADGKASNSTLKSVNPLTNTVIATLGTVPSDIQSLFLFGIGSKLLGTGFGGNPLRQSDVFFVNTDTPHSLTRVTNTPDKDEKSLF